MHGKGKFSGRLSKPKPVISHGLFAVRLKQYV